MKLPIKIKNCSKESTNFYKTAQNDNINKNWRSSFLKTIICVQENEENPLFRDFIAFSQKRPKRFFQYFVSKYSYSSPCENNMSVTICNPGVF